jgi:hypothetical protein
MTDLLEKDQRMKIETFEHALIESSGWAWHHRSPFTFTSALRRGILSVLMDGREIAWVSMEDGWLEVCDFADQRESFSGAFILRGGVAWVLAAMSDAQRSLPNWDRQMTRARGGAR